MRRAETTGSRTRRTASALALALLVTAGRAVADEPASADVAKLRFEQGKSAYREGRYADAIRAFSAADALAPRAALSFDIARAYERLGEPARAIDSYRNYLRRAPDATNADLVRARIAALDATVSEPALGVPAEPPAERAPPAAPLDSHANDAVAEHPSFAPWSWVTLGTGGALLVGAGIAELSRRDAEGDARNASTQLAYVGDYRRMHDAQAVARVLFGVGGVLAVTGVALMAIDLGRGRRAETRVACLPNACFGGVEGSF
jgi:tetratricopeptide (TPR) repeat protein